MNVNKKLGRFKQWAGERMGGEIKTSVSDDFKALEIEMNLRQEGMEKMHRSMTGYVKAISKRSEADTKDKTLPIANLGGTMIQHGDDFEHDSEFGQCLSTFGRTQERMARVQEAYIAAATSSWLESLEKSLVQMREYQAARKKLEQRRLAYDTSLAKMQKAKREDFRVEEELRSQKLKYEEAEEDVYRRMIEIKDAESDNIADLDSFMNAQLEYHEQCRQALSQLRNEWPASRNQPRSRSARPPPRSRSNTVRSMVSNGSQHDDPPALEIRTTFQSGRNPSSRYYDSPVLEHEENSKVRPAFARSTTYDVKAEPRRDMSPVHAEQLPRVPSDSLIKSARSNLKNSQIVSSERDVFGDDSTFYTNSSDRSFGDRSFSSTTSPGSTSGMPSTLGKKKAPPPPPPSRATKPPPPPPPAKRTLIV